MYNVGVGSFRLYPVFIYILLTMAPQQPNSPQYGQGPVNFANQADAGPFASFDNTINYQNMLRYQMVTQYQQQQATPYNLPPSMQRRVLTDPRYSYGVPEGQDPAYYNRQAELNRTAYAGALTTGALGMPAWGAAGVAMAAMKFGGITAFGGSMLLSAPITAIIASRVNQTMERQKYMHSIALDLQQNREKLGMSGLSYNEASALGGSMADMMMEKTGAFGQKQAGFFNAEQMSRIHKIGVAGGMMSAAGPRSGTIGQYQRNFKELVSATEEIVKTLQTTIEGGMSIIKEMNQIGFTTLPQIRSQIKAAKAIGGATGLGFQNTMQLGAAGAQAVQGTPWNASVGASMYQMGAVAASTIAGASRQSAYAVDRVGGVAQAGAVIANAQMNILQSGIGTRIAAYAMNPDGSMNQGRLNAMLSGRVSAYQTVSGANNTGYAMGQDRVRFGMFKADMLNNLSDTERAGLTRQAFRMWGAERYGSLENKAYVFAKNYTNTDDAARVMYESLLGSSGYNLIAGQSMYQNALTAETANVSRISPAWARAAGIYKEKIRDPLYAATDATMATMNAGTRYASVAMGGLRNISIGAVNWAASGLQMGDYGVIDPMRPYQKNTADALAFAYGTKYRGNVAQNMAAIQSASILGKSDIPRIRQNDRLNLPWEQLIRNRSAAETNKIFQMTATLLSTGSSGDALSSMALKNYLGVDLAADYGFTKKDMPGVLLKINRSLAEPVDAISKRFTDTTGKFDNEMARKSAVDKAGINKQMDEIRSLFIASGGRYNDPVETTGNNVILRTAAGSMTLPKTLGEKAHADADYYLKGKQINATKGTDIPYADIQKSSANAIKEAVWSYEAAFKPELATNIAASTELRRWGDKYEEMGVTAKSPILRIAGEAKRKLASFFERDIGKSIKKRYGKNITSTEDLLAFGAEMESAFTISYEELGKLSEKEKKRVENLIQFGRAKNPKTGSTFRQEIASATNEVTRASGESNLEALSNQTGISVDNLRLLAVAPETAVKDKKLRGQLAGQGIDEYNIDRLAGLKEGGIISQLTSKQTYLFDKSYTKKAREIKDNLTSISGLNDSIKYKDKMIIEGIEYGGGKESVGDLRKKLDIAAKGLSLEMQAEQLVASSKGGGNTASVSSPIMNYWNNRWVL